jgi:carbon-monoxide dehydrogenase medium subunit
VPAGARPGRLTIYEPASLEGAVDVLQGLGEDGMVLAGGTAVTLMLRHGLVAPRALVSIAGLPGLDGIAVEGGRIRMGALVTHRTAERSPVLARAAPILARVFGQVANVRVRNQATVGGVVAEADYASDPPSVLVGLDAEVVVTGPAGGRTIPAARFFRGFYETALEPAELVTSVSIPAPPPGLAAVYRRFVSRSAVDRPCVGVFAACRSAGAGRFTDLRVAVGAASDSPQRFNDVEAAAEGSDLSDAVCARVADAYAERIRTLNDVRGSAWYRTEMIRVWVRRALAGARARAAA